MITNDTPNENQQHGPSPQYVDGARLIVEAAVCAELAEALHEVNADVSSNASLAFLDRALGGLITLVRLFGDGPLEVTGPVDWGYNCIAFVLGVRALLAVPNSDGDCTDVLLALGGWRRIDGFAPGCVVAFGLASEGLDGSATTHVARHMDGPWFESKLGLNWRIRHHIPLPEGYYEQEYGEPYRFYGRGPATAETLSTGIDIGSRTLAGLRERQGWTLSQAARACGVDIETWRNADRGELDRRWLTVRELLSVAAASRINPAELIVRPHDQWPAPAWARERSLAAFRRALRAAPNLG